MIFKDRKHAGEELVKALQKYKSAKDAIVLGLPRGGVVVAETVAKELCLPFDIVTPRKITLPENREYAIGAVSEEGEAVLNSEDASRADQKELQEEIDRAKKESARRLKMYRAGRSELKLEGKMAILVDDGVATGLTMRAAVRSARAKKARKIVVAVPHGAKDSMERLRVEADEVIVLQEPIWYGSVGQFYESFPQVEDEEVVKIMKQFTYDFNL